MKGPVKILERDSDNKDVQERERKKLATEVRDYHYSQGTPRVWKTIAHFKNEPADVIRDIVFYRRDLDVMDIEQRSTKT